jgi:hypothetical protein
MVEEEEKRGYFIELDLTLLLLKPVTWSKLGQNCDRVRQVH